MLLIPFLTQLDSRAAIKGSRDPLGVQGIWTRLGRKVVGNLTTVSNSARDFTVLLLGYYFAERVIEAGGTEGELATFLKWEQLAAYARARANPNEGFRGTERVLKRIADGGRVKLGVDNEAQILSNQKIYGLWGLYSVAARSSGLLEASQRLTAETRSLVERVHVPVLAAGGGRRAQGIVECLLGKEHKLDLGRSDVPLPPLLRAVANALLQTEAATREFYCQRLVDGGADDSTGGVQRVFADLLVKWTNNDEWELTPPNLELLAGRATDVGSVGAELAARLRQIRTCELLLAPATELFQFLMACDGQSPATINKSVRATWGDKLGETIDLDATKAIEADLRAGGEVEAGTRWLKLARELSSGSYEAALHTLLEQNAAVMTARSATAPWASFTNGKLQVRFRDEQQAALPTADELPDMWRHAYFIGSLRDVALSLRGAQ